MNKKQVQEKDIELQSLNQHAQHIQQQLNLLDHQFLELLNLEANLKDLEKIKDKRDIFVPLGYGVFIKSELNHIDKVLLNIGANALVKKTIPETQEFVSKQIEEIKELIKRLDIELKDKIDGIQKIEEELRE
jgi:prefoldin alpha subunit